MVVAAGVVAAEDVAAVVVAADMGRSALEVIDLLGLCTVVRRSGTLDGQVPMRAAQGCLPLLEGNALGLQVVLTRPLALARSSQQPGHADVELQRALRVAQPWLAEQGFDGGWHREVLRNVVTAEKQSGALLLWTGLLVRAAPGVVAWCTNAKNRRSPAVDVEEMLIPPGDRLVPLVLRLQWRSTEPQVRLQGEIATLVPLSSGTRVSVHALDTHRSAGEAHLQFYDENYFAEKKGGVTTRYRRHVRAATPEHADGAPALDVVLAGPQAVEVSYRPPLVKDDGTLGPAPPTLLQVATFSNAVALSAGYDGHAVDVTLDPAQLAEGARAVEQQWSDVFGADALRASPGAMLYLTRYANLHPPGEPYFFVKPWALGVTPPGCSTWLEGIDGVTFEVLRGVVRTDVFHALPAVFQLQRSPQRTVLERGRPILRAMAFPRWLQDAPLHLERPLQF